jgi:hypothetical protein
MIYDTYVPKSSLFRKVANDTLKGVEDFEGYLDKKSPSAFRGWQVIELNRL